jgi:hypothetical protein
MRDPLELLKIFTLLYIISFKEKAREYPKKQIEKVLPWIYNRHDIYAIYNKKSNSIFDLELYLIKTKNSEFCQIVSSKSIPLEVQNKLITAEKVIPLFDLNLNHIYPVNAKEKAERILNRLIILSSFL